MIMVCISGNMVLLCHGATSMCEAVPTLWPLREMEQTVLVLSRPPSTQKSVKDKEHAKMASSKRGKHLEQKTIHKKFSVSNQS